MGSRAGSGAGCTRVGSKTGEWGAREHRWLRRNGNRHDTMTPGWVFLCSIAAGAFGQDRPSLQDATNRLRSVGAIDAPVCAGFTAIERERDGVWMANPQGASHLFVNGELFVGDVERRGYRGVPVFLRKGRNDVFALGIDNAFSLSFWQPTARVVMAAWDCFLPRHAEELQASTAEILSSDSWLPVFNASMRPCTFLHRHHGKVGLTGSLFDPGDWADGGRIVPLGIDHTRSFVGFMEDRAPFDETAGGWIPLRAYAEDGRLADLRVLEFRVKGNGRMARPSWPVLGMLAPCSGALRTIGGRGEPPARIRHARISPRRSAPTRVRSRAKATDSRGSRVPVGPRANPPTAEHRRLHGPSLRRAFEPSRLSLDGGSRRPGALGP